LVLPQNDPGIDRNRVAATDGFDDVHSHRPVTVQVGGSDIDRLDDSTLSNPNDHGLERSEMKTPASMKTRNPENVGRESHKRNACFEFVGDRRDRATLHSIFIVKWQRG
jgi:hypothetical protein